MGERRRRRPAQKILIDGWCQQFPSHSVGDLRFGADGALYMTGGEGASFNNADYGQYGGTTGVTDVPKNPCGDPPAGAGGTETAPTARGGALRSQSIRRPTGEPVVLNGSILRVDPATGDALPNNPAVSSTDANARRIVAHGFRNPFRFTIRPGTTEVWIGDVGWNDWEEIDRIVDPLAATVANAGWPCYEGNGQQSGYKALNLDSCNSLYADADRAADPVLHLQPRLAGGERRGLPVGQLVDPGHGVLPGRQLPGGVRERPVLRGPLAQLHLVHARREATACPTRPRSRRSSRPRRTRSTSRRARTATSSTSTSRAATSTASRTPPATRPRRAVIGASPASGPSPLTGQPRRDRLDRSRRLGADLCLGPR